MKKNISKIFLTIMFLLPIKIYALSGNVNINCTPTTTQSPSEISCSISGTSDETVTSIEASIDTSDQIEIVSFTPAVIQDDTAWQGEDVSNKKIEVYTNLDVSGSFSIGTLKLKIKDGTSNGEQPIKLTNIKFGNKDYNNVSIDEVSTTITIKNVIPKGLKSLTITGGTIYQETFSNTNYDYIVMITGSTFGLTAVPTNEGEVASVYDYETGNTLTMDNITFAPQTGKDSMMIVVKVGSGDTLTEYKLNIQKEKTTQSNTDNSLSSLTVGGQRVNLISNQDNYTVILSDVTSYQIKATLKDSINFKFDDINNGSGTYSGEKVITIQILPTDSSSGIKLRTYTITVKKSTESNNQNSSSGNIVNPQTSSISIFIISVILIVSLIISIALFKKNLAYYKK